jgi:cytochrome c oxidase cbb3-type subunit 4
MDINDMRSVITVLAFVSFIGIVLWAYHGKSRSKFEEAARLPFADDGELTEQSTATGLPGRSSRRPSVN